MDRESGESQDEPDCLLRWRHGFGSRCEYQQVRHPLLSGKFRALGARAEPRCYSPFVNESRFIGLGVAAAILVLLVLLPALAIVGFYTFANVYALITGSDFASGTLNPAVFFTGLVVTVAAIVVVIAVVAGLIGRSLSPKRKGEQDDGPLFGSSLDGAEVSEP